MKRRHRILIIGLIVSNIFFMNKYFRSEERYLELYSNYIVQLHEELEISTDRTNLKLKNELLELTIEELVDINQELVDMINEIAQDYPNRINL